MKFYVSKVKGKTRPNSTLPNKMDTQ